MFNPLHSITNQELFKSTSEIKVATMKKMDGFRYEGKPSCATATSTPFSVSKDEWDAKETLVSPRRIYFMYCSMPKGMCLAEVTSNSEKIKLIALAIIKLHLSEGISHLLSQSVENSV